LEPPRFFDPPAVAKPAAVAKPVVEKAKPAVVVQAKPTATAVGAKRLALTSASAVLRYPFDEEAGEESILLQQSAFDDLIEVGEMVSQDVIDLVRKLLFEEYRPALEKKLMSAVDLSTYRVATLEGLLESCSPDERLVQYRRLREKWGMKGLGIEVDFVSAAVTTGSHFSEVQLFPNDSTAVLLHIDSMPGLGHADYITRVLTPFLNFCLREDAREDDRHLHERNLIVGATRVEGVARQPTSGPHVNLCGFSSLLGLETALTMLKTHACEVSGVGALSRMRSVELTVDSYIEKLRS
jgi:hypothetical protein